MTNPALILSMLWLGGTMSLPQPTYKSDVQTRHRVDSLVSLMDSTHNLATKIIACEALVNELFSARRIDTAITVAVTAHELALKFDDPRLVVKTLYLLAVCYGNSGLRDYDKSLHYARQAEALASRHNFYTELHVIYSTILNNHFYLGDFPAAMASITAGLHSAETHRDQKNVAKYNSLLGFVHLRLGNSADAEKFYNYYLRLSREIGDSIAVADAFNSLGEVFMSTNKNSLSLKYHKLAWAIYKDHYPDRLNHRYDQLAYTAFKISNAYKIVGDFEEALRYSKLGFQYIEKHGANEYDRVSYLLSTSYIYKSTGAYEDALRLIHHALALSKQIDHKENIRDAYRSLSDIYTALKSLDSALYYHLLFTAAKDSIINEQSRNAVQRIHALYDLQKKDQAIAIQQAEIENRSLQRNVIALVFIFTVVLLILIYNRHRLKQGNKFQAQLAHERNELFNTIISIQDRERTRIAQDLHDGLGSVLAAAKFKLTDIDIVRGRLTPREIEEYRAVIALVDEAAIELRNVSHNIMPATLSKIGLVAALRNIFDNISGHLPLQILYNTHGFNTRLDEQMEISLYRILMELTNNVIKHAKATEVVVQLIKYPTHLNIMVEDNGVGFDPHDKNGNNGIGLDNALARIDYLKETMDIESRPGQGTSIIINIPINEH